MGICFKCLTFSSVSIDCSNDIAVINLQISKRSTCYKTSETVENNGILTVVYEVWPVAKLECLLTTWCIMLKKKQQKTKKTKNKTKTKKTATTIIVYTFADCDGDSMDVYKV